MRLPIWPAVVLSLAACSPSAGDAAAGTATPAPGSAAVQQAHPESGLKVIPLSVKTESRTHKFSVEVAQTRVEQAKGLMFRTRMGEDEGMLFPFPEPREANFWMRNTVIPLDIIFIGSDRRILNIEADAVPYSEDRRSSDGEAAAVLEINGGRAAALGIGPGDKVDW